MANLQLALQGASQGLSQMADLQARREAAQIEMLRRENLMMLTQHMEFVRQANLQGNQAKLNRQRDAARIGAQEHARTGEINLQEDLRGRNELAREDASFKDRQSLQQSAQAFEGDYRNRADQAAAYRGWLTQREGASRDMTTLRGQLMARARQIFGEGNTAQAFAQQLATMGGPNAQGAAGAPDSAMMRQLLADPIGGSIASQYHDAWQRRSAADAQLNTPKFTRNFAGDMAAQPQPTSPLIDLNDPNSWNETDATSGEDADTAGDVSRQPDDEPPQDNDTTYTGEPGSQPDDFAPAVDPDSPANP